MQNRPQRKLPSVCLLTALLCAFMPSTIFAQEEPEQYEPLSTMHTAEPAAAMTVAQPNPNYPDIIPIEMNVVQIASDNHNLLLDDEGNVWAWGLNNYAQAGNGTTLTQIDLPDKAVKVEASHDSSIVLLEDGSVYVWGTQDTLKRPNPTEPYKVEGLGPVVDFSSWDSTFVKLEDGAVYGWGTNSYGELGLGHTITVSSLVEIPALHGRNLPINVGTSRFLIEGDSVTAWGSNHINSLRLPEPSPTNYQATPALSVLKNVSSVSGGYIRNIPNMYAITNAGELLVWGDNSNYMLGLGHFNAVEEPTIVPLEGKVVKSVGTQRATAILKEDGTVWTVGYDPSYGSLGLGIGTAAEFTQVDLPPIVQIEAGVNHFYAQTESGDWWAWGINYYNQVSPGGTSYTTVTTPVLVFAASDPVQDGHNVTVIVKYGDGAYPDDITTYNVPAGSEFSEGYNVYPGYEYRGVSLYSLFYQVDATNQTVYISEVNQDITVELQYERSEYNVTVTTRYEDGVLEEKTETYSVPKNEPFSTTFEMLDGYAVDIVEANILGVAVDGFEQTITIRNVSGEVYITIVFKKK